MHSFQAEVSQVLRLVVGSLYSNQEIFLRELISNASDALDKLRFEAIANPQLLEGDPELVIRVSADEQAGTLTLSDNGIGMTRDELAKNLGTIAHSGSKAFVEQLAKAQAAAKQDQALQLIGQFGVGFYSAFLVADRVDVVSRRAGEAGAMRWSSDAKEGYTLEAAERAGRGTDVTLHLKEDAKEYLKRWRIEELVTRYSDYVSHPIELREEPPAKTAGDDEGAPGDAAAGDAAAGDAAAGDAERAPSYRRLNQGSALWQRSPKEVTDEQYADFYKHLTRDYEAPLARRHFHVEGTQMFAGLLFIPKRAPMDLFDPEVKRGIRLHVRRVFVMNDCDELLPRWLRFVRGVLDSEDLPLNVSREILQDSKAVRLMRRQVISQTLSMLEELATERPDDYASFFQAFGMVLKEGLHFEPDHEKRLAELVRYQSSAAPEQLTSLAEYVARMPEGQPAIYYVTGAERRLVERSPHLEALRARGYEVLYMTDPVDPFVVETLKTYGEKPLVNAMSEALDVGGEEEASSQEARDVAHQSLLERFQAVLAEQVSQVRTSTRLKGSPVCLVIPEGGLAPHLERLMRAQRLGVPTQKRVLELNSEHPLIKRLDELNGQPERADDVTEWISVLYDQALLAEGSPLEDPARLAERLTTLMTRAAG